MLISARFDFDLVIVISVCFGSHVFIDTDLCHGRLLDFSFAHSFLVYLLYFPLKSLF